MSMRYRDYGSWLRLGLLSVRPLIVVKGVLSSLFLLLLIHTIVTVRRPLEASVPASHLTNSELARLMAEAPRVAELALSPDGMTIAYVVRRGSVGMNQIVSELLLQQLDASGAPQGEVVRIERRSSEQYPPASFGVRWHPSGEYLTYYTKWPIAEKENGAKVPLAVGSGPGTRSRALVKYERVSGRIALIPVFDNEAPTGDGGRVTRPRIETIPENFRWAPRGKVLAFTAAIEGVRRLNPRAGTLETLDLDFLEPSPRAGLFVLDVATGAIAQASPDTLHVIDFGWAPDERAFVIEARRHSTQLRAASTDLYIVDRATGLERPLVIQPGRDSTPTWSPDGKWIAFSSQFGTRSMYYGAAALVAATGGSVVRLAQDDEPVPGGGVMGVWTSDSLSFYYASHHDLVGMLVRADVREKRVTIVAPEKRYADADFSFSADGRRVAFSRQTLADPPEVYVQTLPGGTPRAITALSAGFPLAERVRIDRVRWPSRDGKLTLHGLLLTPRSAWHADGKSVKAPLPTVINNPGGPSMVYNGSFTAGYNRGMLPLAVQGYAVLFPNIRIRNGGGPALYKSESNMRVPNEDMLAGIDRLVEKGIADPRRLGVYGHSYGARLAVYSITQTDRFKAAVVHESFRPDTLPGSVRMPGSDQEVIQRERYGIPDIIDPAFRDRLIAEVAFFHMSRVTTPTLLQYGHSGHAKDAGILLFKIFQRLKVPTEFVLYDEPHVSYRPAAVADEISHTAAWYDYWLRELPYPDPVRARAYDEWRAARASDTKAQPQE